jgi:ligand-binding sensor domain-containing protein
VQLYTPANSPLPSVDVRVAQPVGGVVWIGGGGGASVVDGATWTTYTPDDGLASALVTAISADSQNRVWLGTDAGLSIWTGTSFFNLTTANGLPSNDITALTSTGDVVWIGTRGGGLLRFQDNQLQLFNTGNSNLPSNSVTALATARDGSLYIGTEAGVAHFDDSTLRGDAGLGPVAITALAAAPNGEVWAATGSNELQRFDGAAWNLYEASQLPATAITALVLDAAGDLWIGGAQGGVVRYTP